MDTFTSYYEVFEGTTFLVKSSNDMQLSKFHSILHRDFHPGKQILKNLDNIFIFVYFGEQRVKKTLLNCLQGKFCDDSYKNDYWIVGGDWYEKSNDYAVEIFKQYHQVIRRSLRTKEDSHVYISWPYKPTNMNTKLPYIDERSYNDKYEAIPDFVVTDFRFIMYGVEICDLFQHIPNTNGKSIYLYHVKKVFGPSAYRDVIGQIRTSATLLYNDLSSKGATVDSSAFKLFQFVQKNLAEDDKYKDFDEFRLYLKDATYVLAPLFKSGQRDLDKDSAFRTTFDFNDIKNEIRPKFWDRLRIELLEFLSNHEFINSHKEFTTKWYETFAIPDDRRFDAYVNSFPSKKVSGLEPHILLKILKRQYYKQIDGLAVKQLIVDIINDQLKKMNFRFMICQIEKSENDKR